MTRERKPWTCTFIRLTPFIHMGVGALETWSESPLKFRGELVHGFSGAMVGHACNAPERPSLIGDRETTKRTEEEENQKEREKAEKKGKGKENEKEGEKERKTGRKKERKKRKNKLT